MKILSLGSLNIDRVYSVSDFVKPSETISALDYNLFCGGKGLNQSIALARAGAHVLHAGCAGADGDTLCALLDYSGVDTSLLMRSDISSGHAVIQVTPSGQNCIIVYPGANNLVSKEYIDTVLSGFGSGDMILMQNEVSNIAYAIEAAHSAGIKIALNPSPITAELLKYPLDKVDIFILNEVEGGILSGEQGYENILQGLAKAFPNAQIVLTAGRDGAYYCGDGISAYCPSCNVTAVDTTAAGDTFCGYFLACIAKGMTPEEALQIASKASGLAVMAVGAAPSIPLWEQVIHSDIMFRA